MRKKYLESPPLFFLGPARFRVLVVGPFVHTQVVALLHYRRVCVGSCRRAAAAAAAALATKVTLYCSSSEGKGEEGIFLKSDHYPVTTHLKKKPKPPPLDGGGKEPGAEGGGTVAFWSRFSHIFPRRKRERRSFAGAGNAPNFFLRERLVFGFREMQKIGGSN